MHASHLHISMCILWLSMCTLQLNICILQLSMCTHPIEHTHAFRWAGARVTPTHQHILTSVEDVHASVEDVQTSVERVHTPSWAYARYFRMFSWKFWALNAYSWAHACSLLSICTLTDKHAHATSWAYAHFTPRKQHLHTAVVHVHASSWACTHINWACAHFQLGIHTLPVEHVSHPHISMCTLQLSMCKLSTCTISVGHMHTSRRAHLTPTHQHVHASVEHVQLFRCAYTLYSWTCERFQVLVQFSFIKTTVI